MQLTLDMAQSSTEGPLNAGEQASHTRAPKVVSRSMHPNKGLGWEDRQTPGD